MPKRTLCDFIRYGRVHEHHLLNRRKTSTEFPSIKLSVPSEIEIYEKETNNGGNQIYLSEINEQTPVSQTNVDELVIGTENPSIKELPLWPSLLQNDQNAQKGLAIASFRSS